MSETSALPPEPTAEDLLTVAEAAEALGVSVPRLRRVLGRPEWSGRTETRTRQTRTGTRTGTVLNSSLLPELKLFLEESNSFPSPVEREREQDATETGTRTGTVRNENGNESNGSDHHDWKARALVAEAEKEGLTLRLADTASDRDAWKEQAGKLDSRLAEALEALQRAQDETRATRALSARSAMQIEAVGAPDVPHAQDAASEGAKTPLNTVRAPSEALKLRPWWAFWKARG